MTIKEITVLLNKRSTKTILSWIKNGQNMTEIGQKLTIAEKAKNRNMQMIDYAEQEGLTPILLSIAKEIFK